MTTREALVAVSNKLADLEDEIGRCLTDTSRGGLGDDAWFFVDLKNRVGVEHRAVIRRISRSD